MSVCFLCLVWTHSSFVCPKGELDEVCTPMLCWKYCFSHVVLRLGSAPKGCRTSLVQSCMCINAVARWVWTCGDQKWHGLLKSGRQAVFYTTVNPMEDEYGMGEIHAIFRDQGSRHTRILGNAFKIQYFGAIWSSLKRKACNFTRHGHMQSFSTIHCLQLALRKQYAWKLRMSSTKRFA